MTAWFVDKFFVWITPKKNKILAIRENKENTLHKINKVHKSGTYNLRLYDVATNRIAIALD